MKYFLLAAFACSLFVATSCKKDKTKEVVDYGNGVTDSLKLNQIQIIASHNSYHIKPSDSIFQFLSNLLNAGILPTQYDPSGIDYSHIPLEQQFNNYNVRGIELDIFNDPVGGLFYNRQGVALTSGGSGASNIPELQQPGFKLLHIPDFDFDTHHATFKSSLLAVYNWSMAHPNHLPIFINVETKDDAPGNTLTGLGLAVSVSFDATACDKMDEEIKSVFGDNLDKVITPDDVRGSFSTLEEAALAGNWPQLAKARGKVVFIMQGAAESLYKAGHPSLNSRAMFVYSNPGTPEAAFVILNSSVGDFDEIRQRVSEGYIVRTRTDSGTDEARTGNYTNMNAAFESWAQIVSTDYYKADERAGTSGWTDYHVQFPNGELARIDSISASDKLTLGILKE